ncbi:deoxyribose-phosphate aldolase [Flavobacterium sp. MK4S-17]|uniref:deoxyribose-phosphate aldolase n=1 Tax=Flavobacterium sp. MK4S-17 TaxID=2543737 RepID=UPI0013586912|nr:deoxyribose-phosphate aldolase [Flavobacterium sp. MK4S-17]
MDIKQYLDSTYLKTAAQAGVTEEENIETAKHYINEAIAEKFKLIMIRPEMVRIASSLTDAADSLVLVGTVIDFPEGSAPLFDKLKEAQQAIDDGADELDYVINYTAFKAGDIDSVKKQVYECTALGLKNNKTVKWIIETAALTDSEIVRLCVLIKNVVLSHFEERYYERVFVKSSTGFYKTEGGAPNGATVPAIKLMLENSFPLPVKASGGVRTYDEAIEMISLGVKRIGTSSAKAIAYGGSAESSY